MKVSHVVILLGAIIAYGIYCQAVNGQDLFTAFWSFLYSIGG